ncbi:MAG: hypothetical protein K8R21_05425 [Leptospira sp.]|nr:hypothetical protein [Leptospira sp.]
MFTLSSIKKLKQELLNSLKIESKEIITLLPPRIREKAKSVIMNYKHHQSLAGIEFFNNAANEYIYFANALKEFNFLSAKKKTSAAGIHDFFSRQFKSDFGEEDYRFLGWERANLTYDSLMEILRSFQDNSLAEIISKNPFFTRDKKQSLLEFRLYRKNPKTTGDNNSYINRKTPGRILRKLDQAEKNLSLLWKEGYERYRLLTDKIIIVKSKDLVSYSHFHEPGISYLNLIDRTNLDAVDDLVHENAHHHLNLILKKYRIIAKEDKREIFYSPWRDSLRPLYAILHSVFTFSFGADLFREILYSGNFGKSSLNKQDLDRARFRFIQESISTNYSLSDLQWGIENGYFTGKGILLIRKLKKMNSDCLSLCQKTEREIRKKEFRLAIRNFDETLKEKRKHYRIIS